MLFLLSPAKTLDLSKKEIPFHTEPRMLEKSQKLVNNLKKQSVGSFQQLMNINEKIAKENQTRYREYHLPFTEENAKPAALSFKGDVYRGLDFESLNKTEIKYAQKHVRILSGLYGILRPMDLIQAYRLEMGTKLKVGRKNNLYDFWGDDITHIINEDLKDFKNPIIINLASKEYFQSINEKKINADIYTINFKEKRKGKYMFLSFNAKRARGLMCNFAIKTKAKTPEDLKAFDLEDYTYNPGFSSEKEFIFTR
jgi:cytoplasmic iron level regulating protein YaaA (DUF328/UPF0246 family)